MPFKKIKNIQTSFQMMKWIFFLSIAVLSILSVVVVGLYFKASQDMSNKIYVLTDEGEIFSAKSSIVKDNRVAEIKNHIKMFYGTFFSYDQNNMEESIKQGLYLIGQSGKVMYQSFVEKGWYNNVLQNNINVNSYVHLDSIYVDANSYPYLVYAKGFQKISRESVTEKHHLDFKCSLINISRSDYNPHGLLIDNFELINNEIINE